MRKKALWLLLLFFVFCTGCRRSAPVPVIDYNLSVYGSGSRSAFAETDDTYYAAVFQNDPTAPSIYLYRSPKETLAWEPVCSRQGCRHDGRDCFAYLNEDLPSFGIVGDRICSVDHKDASLWIYSMDISGGPHTEEYAFPAHELDPAEAYPTAVFHRNYLIAGWQAEKPLDPASDEFVYAYSLFRYTIGSKEPEEAILSHPAASYDRFEKCSADSWISPSPQLSSDGGRTNVSLTAYPYGGILYYRTGDNRPGVFDAERGVTAEPGSSGINYFDLENWNWYNKQERPNITDLNLDSVLEGYPLGYPAGQLFFKNDSLYVLADDGVYCYDDAKDDKTFSHLIVSEKNAVKWYCDDDLIYGTQSLEISSPIASALHLYTPDGRHLADLAYPSDGARFYFFAASRDRIFFSQDAAGSLPTFWLERAELLNGIYQWHTTGNA